MANADYTIRAGAQGFCPVGYLNADITQLQTAVVMMGYTSPIVDGIRLGMAAMIDEEIVEVVARSGNNLTLARGCCDTVPALHSAGAGIWFFDGSIASDRIEYAGTETIGVKVLPRISSGAEVPIENSPPAGLTFNLRFARPYPPGLVEVNGDPWFTDPIAFNLDVPTLVITWAHRDRITQQDQLVDHLEADVGPEPETTYELRVYKADDTLLRTVVGLTGTTWSYEFADAALDFSAAGSDYPGYITLCSRRDGLASFQQYRIDFTFESSTVPSTPPCITALLHFDGTHGATTTVDSSVTTKTVTIVGTATLSTTWAKFGSASLAVPNTGASTRNGARITDHTDFDWGTANFRIGCHFRRSSNTRAGIIFTVPVEGSNELRLWVNTSGLLRVGWKELAWQSNNLSTGMTVPLDTPTWVELVRRGGVYEVWMDGFLVHSAPLASGTAEVVNCTGDIYVGCDHIDGTGSLDGYIDEFVITNSLADTQFTTFDSTDPHWANVVFLTNGDTTTDQSSYNKTTSIVGTTAVVSDEGGWAGHPYIQGAVNSYLMAILGADGSMAGDFTIEVLAGSGSAGVVFMAESAGYLYADAFSGYGAANLTMGSTNLNVLDRVHYEVSRVGSTIRGFRNGKLTGSQTYAGTVNLQTLRFGMFVPNGNLYWEGKYGQIRVTKGVGRHTADFNIRPVPTTAYGPYDCGVSLPDIPDVIEETFTLTTSLVTQPAGATIAMNLTQLAAPTSAGSAYVGIFYCPTALQADPLPDGTTLSVSFGIGLSQSVAVLTVLSYTAVGATSKATAMAALIAQANAATALSSRGLTASANSYLGSPGMQIQGPDGFKLHSSFGIMDPGVQAPVFTQLSNLLVAEFTLGSPAVGSALNQLVTATLSGTPAAGDQYTVTLNGVAYSHTAASGATLNGVATALAALIDAASAYAASAVGPVITIDGVTATNVFTYSSSAEALFAF